LNAAADNSPSGGQKVVRASRSHWQVIWRQFKFNRLAVLGLIVICLFFMLSIYAPILANNKPFVFRSADGQLHFPLLRELCAPSGEISENSLEISFNFIMLLTTVLALAVLPLKMFLKRLSLSERTIWKKALPYGLLAAVGGGAIMAALMTAVLFIYSWQVGKGPAGSPVPFLLLHGKLIAGIFASLAAFCCGTAAVWFMGRGQQEVSPRRGRFIALAASTGLLVGLLILPFAMTKGRLDKRDYYGEAVASSQDQSCWGVFPPVHWGPFQQVVGGELKAPDAAHLLGTDNIGRDVLARVLHGGRVSLAVGFVAVGIYLFIGIVVGLMAGYFGGWVDLLVSRLVEIMMGFPTFMLILTILVVFDARSVVYVMLVLGITGWTGVARLTRGEVLKQRGSDYVTAARAMGLGAPAIMFKHILPNAIAPVFVSATFGVAGAILTESTLSFLGFGVAPPTASWGELLNQAQGNPIEWWWLTLFPGLIIFLAITSYNLVGEGLRDALDPRLRK
jgi:ABC-type dipeptide/oligopeptide/nickel transport system permease subunit